jgi:hypothetical protein
MEQAIFIRTENKKCNDGKKITNAYKAPKEDAIINFIRLDLNLANLPVRDNIK